MSVPCKACGQLSRDGALLCEFCKAPFTKLPRATPVRARQPPEAAAAQPRRWSTAALAVTGLLGVAVGFAARGFPAAPAAALPAPAPSAPALAAAEPVVAVKPEVAPLELRAEVTPPVEVRKAPVLAPPGLPPPGLAPVALAPQPEPVARPAVPAPEPTLRTFTVPYTAREGTANRVIIQVTFNDAVTVPMALDTGAPGTIISTDLAQRLGLLKPNEGHLVTVAQGIGGATAALTVVLKSLAVDKARTEFVMATAVSRMSEAFEGVVGMDFVAGYALELDTPHKLLVLKELPAQSASPGGHDERWWREAFGSVARQKLAWSRVAERLGETVRLGAAPPGMSASDAKALAELATEQNREIEVLAGKLEQHASKNAVPREWRSY